MKKLIKTILFLQTTIFFFFCSPKKEIEEAEKNKERPITIEDQYQACRSLADYHSQALDVVFQSIQISLSRTDRIVDNIDLSKVTSPIRKFLSVQTASKELPSIYQRLEFSFFDKSIRSAKKIASIENVVSNELDSFVKEIKEKDTKEVVKQKIRLFINEDEIKNLSLDEKKLLLVRLAIYEDSYSYWSENLPKWTLSKEEQEKLNSSSPLFGLKEFWNKVKRIAKADAEGPKADDVVAAGVAGAVAGAAAGSLVGGAGAGPGAAAGAVVGAGEKIVEEAVVASLSATKEEGESKKDNNNGKK